MSGTFTSKRAAWRRAKRMDKRPLDPIFRTVWFNGIPKKVWIQLVPMPYRLG